MYTTKDNKGHIKVSLTLTFKVKCQGHVIGFVFFEILDLEKVRIDTEIFTNWLTGVSDRLSTLDMRVCGVPGTRILDMLSAK